MTALSQACNKDPFSDDESRYLWGEDDYKAKAYSKFQGPKWKLQSLSPRSPGISPMWELPFLFQVATRAQELTLGMGLKLSLKFKNPWVL